MFLKMQLVEVGGDSPEVATANFEGEAGSLSLKVGPTLAKVLAAELYKDFSFEIDMNVLPKGGDDHG